jgi:hypothetical protein
MKRVIIGLVIALASAQPASADVYVKVDAQGNAIGGAIVCDAATCGAGSDYSRLTLAPGERYALQGTGSTGIGNNNPGITAKVDLQSNDWTVTTTTVVNLPEPIKLSNKEITSVTTQTTEKFNPIQPSTPAPVIKDPVQVPTTDTATVTTGSATTVIDTATATTETTETVTPIDYSTLDWEAIDWEDVNWEVFWVWFEKWLDELFAVKP